MIDIVSKKQMQEFDKFTIENKTPSIELMYRAAFSVYNSYDFKSKKIYIICGSGNNGGDGLALALILFKNNIDCFVYLVKEKLSDDANYYLQELKKNNFQNIFNIKDCDFNSDVIVDCILGTGFSGDVKEEIAKIIEKINASLAYKISVDISSGLNSTSGLTKCAVKADLTVAIQYYKYGHFLGDGKDYSKDFTCSDIGIEKTEKTAQIIEKKDLVFEKRKANTSKHFYGASLIIGGSKNYVGAIKLANMGLGALRVGAGLNTIASVESLSCAIKSNIIESTFYPLDEENGFIKFNKKQIDELIKNKSAIVLGMGLGNNYKENKILIEYILNNFEGKVLLDADAINTYKDNILDLKNRKCELCLTPHIKEFSRLISIDEEVILQDPVYYVSMFAKKINATILLKGPTTIIANEDEVYFVINGTPALAKGGSGDCLSGVILGFLAQNFKPAKACYYAAYLCAEAAKMASEEFSEYGTLASDVARQINKLIKY